MGDGVLERIHARMPRRTQVHILKFPEAVPPVPQILSAERLKI
jgi:hypothetical protein